MIMTEKKPGLDFCSGREAELRVERRDISFQDLGGDLVRITVTVRNVGADRSPPTRMRLESAPLGAFVPWQPLTQLMVPPLEPGESRDLSTDVVRPRPAPLGDFNRVPPRKLLTAINSPDQSLPQSGTGFSGLMDLWLKQRKSRSASGAGAASLAPDPWDLLDRSQPHWAGNINVFVGGRAVERHLAKALRVYPGRTNLTMFMVGGPGKYDAYAFRLMGMAPDWQASLYDLTSCESLVLNPLDPPLEETHWVESDALMAMLAIVPPPDCRAGNLEVHVTRRSCGKTAIVEFNLEPSAQGPGCYFV